MLFGQRPAKKEVFETIFNNTDIAPLADRVTPSRAAALAARWLGDKSNYLSEDSELEFSQLIKDGGKKRAAFLTRHEARQPTRSYGSLGDRGP